MQQVRDLATAARKAGATPSALLPEAISRIEGGGGVVIFASERLVNDNKFAFLLAKLLNLSNSVSFGQDANIYQPQPDV